MNFQYIEAHDAEYLNSSFKIRETILSLKEKSQAAVKRRDKKWKKVLEGQFLRNYLNI